MPKNFNYPLTAVASGPDTQKLAEEIQAIDGLKKLTVRGDAIVIQLDTDVAQATMDALIAAHDPFDLAGVKALKFEAIDKRTNELIAQGFDFGGKTMSLSLEYQNRITAAYSTRNDPAFTYPIIWNTIDDNDTVSINDANGMRDLHLAGLAAIRGHLDSGTAIKDLVRAATTIAEVEAVEDNR